MNKKIADWSRKVKIRLTGLINIIRRYSILSLLFLILFMSAMFIFTLVQTHNVKSKTAIKLLQNAENASNKGNPDSAQTYVNFARKFKVHKDSVYLYSGKIALQQNLVADAERYFRVSLKENRHFSDAYLQLAETVERQGRIDQAIQYFQNVLHKNPENFNAQMGIANAYFKKIRLDSIGQIPIDELILAAPFYEKILRHPELNQQLKLVQYIQLNDNLARLDNTPLRSSLFDPTYIQKSSIAKDIYRVYGERSGSIELVEARFHYLKNEKDRAEQLLTELANSDSSFSKTAEQIRIEYEIIKNWQGKTGTSANEAFSPQFRFNRHRTGRIAGNGIVLPRIKWRTRIGKVGMISPIIYRDKIIQVAPELGRVVFMDITSGEIIKLLKKNDGFSASTPAIAEGYLWLDAPRGTMYLISMKNYMRLNAFEDSPVNEPYFQEIIDSSPLIRGDRVLFCTRRGQFRSALYKEGRRRVENLVWSESIGETTASPVIGDSLAMFGSNDGRFYAVSFKMGLPYLKTAWLYPANGTVTASATFAKGAVYLGDHNGIIHAIPEKLIHERKEGGFNVQSWLAKFNARGGIYASPAIDDSLVYFCTIDSMIYALPTFDAKEFKAGDMFRNNWRPRYSYKTEGAVYSSPCIYGGVLYVGTDAGEILALEAGDIRNRLWRLVVDGPVKSSPLVANNTLYIAADDGYFYAIGE